MAMSTKLVWSFKQYIAYCFNNPIKKNLTDLFSVFFRFYLDWATLPHQEDLMEQMAVSCPAVTDVPGIQPMLGKLYCVTKLAVSQRS